MSWFWTHSGLQFDFVNPQPEMVDIIDIAYGLSRHPRFSGQTFFGRKYNVAHHSVLALRLAIAEVKKSRLLFTGPYCMKVLLHDAHEGYMGDAVRNMKEQLPDWQALEEKIQAVIWKRFDLSPPSAEEAVEIKRIDRGLAYTEGDQLLRYGTWKWPEEEDNSIERFDIQIYPWSSRKSRRKFLEDFRSIGYASGLMAGYDTEISQIQKRLRREFLESRALSAFPA